MGLRWLARQSSPLSGKSTSEMMAATLMITAVHSTFVYAWTHPKERSWQRPSFAQITRTVDPRGIIPDQAVIPTAWVCVFLWRAGQPGPARLPHSEGRECWEGAFIRSAGPCVRCYAPRTTVGASFVRPSFEQRHASPYWRSTVPCGRRSSRSYDAPKCACRWDDTINSPVVAAIQPFFPSVSLIFHQPARSSSRVNSTPACRGCSN